MTIDDSAWNDNAIALDTSTAFGNTDTIDADAAYEAVGDFTGSLHNKDVNRCYINLVLTNTDIRPHNFTFKIRLGERDASNNYWVSGGYKTFDYSTAVPFGEDGTLTVEISNSWLKSDGDYGGSDAGDGDFMVAIHWTGDTPSYLTGSGSVTLATSNALVLDSIPEFREVTGTGICAALVMATKST